MIDFNALEDLCEINEQTPDDNWFLGYWINACGTKACLVGNFCLARPADELKIRHRGPVFRDNADSPACAERFGISTRESEFLFAAMDYAAAPSANDCDIEWLSTSSRCSAIRSQTDKAAAINRVRKFLAYKLRKQQIFADLDRARKQEGDWMVVRHVQEELTRVAEMGALAK